MNSRNIFKRRRQFQCDRNNIWKWQNDTENSLNFSLCIFQQLDFVNWLKVAVELSGNILYRNEIDNMWRTSLCRLSSSSSSRKIISLHFFVVFVRLFINDAPRHVFAVHSLIDELRLFHSVCSLFSSTFFFFIFNRMLKISFLAANERRRETRMCSVHFCLLIACSYFVAQDSYQLQMQWRTQFAFCDVPALVHEHEPSV